MLHATVLRMDEQFEPILPCTTFHVPDALSFETPIFSINPFHTLWPAILC